MWSDLYRCSVLFAWLAMGVAMPEGVAVGQESVPAPAAEVDPDAESPFLNESPVNSPGTLDRFHLPILRQDLKINGAQSCATSNCHAGPRPGVLQRSARRGMEYQVWVENDPHAQSWRTICSDESVAIMNRLKIIDGDVIVDPIGFDNCLACHNSTRRFNEPRGTGPEQASSQSPGDVNSFRREGVGCSGCHGPSQQWISTHFQYHWSPQGATADGFVEAGDLYVRARMCASCHVGDKDRDMNHDIIAAGHPTLRYELATFHAWQPKHWRDAEANDKTFYEAQLWLAGQVASTDASLALLHSRAADAHTVSEWPEFAAYDCASCHHNLALDNTRSAFNDNRRATAIYSQWNDAGLRWLIHYRMETGEAKQPDFDLISALDIVKQQMEAKPKPNADSVAEATAAARKALAAWFDSAAGLHERTMFRSDRLGRVVASAAGKRDSFQTWESAVQFYLAAVAARESWPGGWHGPMRNIADQLRIGLRYPEMIDISRYAGRDGSGPQLDRTQAMRLGIELAGWLGPVQAEMIDEAIEDTPQDVRRRLDQLMKEINARWETRRIQRDAAEAKAAETESDKIEVPPRRTPKTAEELFQERKPATDNNTDNSTDSNDSL